MEFDTAALTSLAISYGIQLLSAIVALVVGLYIVNIIVGVIGKVLDKSNTDPSLVGFIRSLVSILLKIMVYITAIGMLGVEMTSFIAILGAAGLAVGMALSGTLQNFAGGVMILLFKPFKVGDRVQIGENAGDVIDIRLFQFSINETGNWVDADQSTGRIIHIPNGIVFTEPQASYTAGFQYIWNEIPVLITFESDWKKAKQILSEIVNHHGLLISENAEDQVKEAAKKFLIFYTKLTPIVYTSVKDSGVMLTLRFMCDPRKRRSISEIIWEDILDRFEVCNDIDFAYPTQRFYNITESKK